MNQFKIPKETFNSLKKPNKLLIISLLTIIISNCITIFGFKLLDIKIKISLAIFSLVLLIDVVILYTQYYMFYYQTEYFNKIYRLIDLNVENLDQTLLSLEKESTEIRDSVNENNKEIEMLKSKIS